MIQSLSGSRAETSALTLRTLFNRLYFHLKPFLPRSVRLAARRVHATRIWERSGDVWPILEAAGDTPSDWGGWPDGCDYAFVLTHDVESQAGVDNVRKLAELEMECGFRSSFNFIPVGSYEVPVGLREWLTGNGFEVGVHDLHHDGHLYQSRRAFTAHAKKINEFLRDWKAAGFRSGFMLRELDWLHDLEIKYDASTFDTDPFEPQPDGAETIFPFWKTTEQKGVKSPSYVELPYTLPQDSTLFLALSQRNIDIWKTKFDWLTSKRGMALLNTHPDYVDFDGGASPHMRYPASYYRDFLNYVKNHREGSRWDALPNDLADMMIKNLSLTGNDERKGGSQ